MTWRRLLLSLLPLCVSGCVGVPTPLAPGQQGSVGVPHSGVQTDAVQLPTRGEGFVRIALVENEQRIRQAARNIRRFLETAPAQLHNVVPLATRR